jgi:hypothetical protein
MQTRAELERVRVSGSETRFGGQPHRVEPSSEEAQPGPPRTEFHIDGEIRQAVL